MQITSRHNPKLKQAQTLRNRRSRDSTGLAIVDGVRETLRAASASVVLRQMFVCDDMLAEDERDWLSTLAQQHEAEWLELDRDLFAKVAYGDRYDGVIAIVEPRRYVIDDLALGDKPLVVVVEGIEKPGNLGAILRTADGAGIDAVVVADAVIDLFNPNTIRASVATVFHRRVVTSTATNTRDWLIQLKLPIHAAQPEATSSYTAADFSRGGVIILGSEADGLSDVWQHEAVRPIRLPMLGIADSLNVSVTAAILMYEARRQLTGSKP